MSAELGIVELGRALLNFKEYWSTFRNKKIQITTESFSLGTERNLESWNTIIVGTIDSIQVYPPGIRLKEVEKSLKYSTIRISRSGSPLGPQVIEPINVEYLEKLFVSFHSITLIEWLE